MFGDAWRRWAICATAQFVALPAFADALPLRQTLEIGKPARPLTLELTATGEKPALRVGGTAIALPFKSISDASAESVAVAEDAKVAILRVTAEGGAGFAILGGRSGKDLLVAARSDRVGDPGEGHATTLAIEPGPNGAQRVSVGTRYDGFARCGAQGPTLLDARRVDPQSLRLVNESAVPPIPEDARPLTPEPGAVTPSSLQLLSASGSSQIDSLTGTPQVPHALNDQNDDTSWEAKPGDTASFRWAAPNAPIESFELLVGPHSKPAELVLWLEHVTYTIALPAAAQPERVSLKPEKPVQSGCVSLTLTSRAPLEVASFGALSEFEGPDGLSQLASLLIQDGPRAALAADLLERLGEPAAQVLAARYAELSPRGRRRALKVFAGPLDQPAVRARVLEAARSDDELLSTAALGLLQRSGEAGKTGLRELALEPTRSGDAAARLLSMPGSEDVDALLEALGRPHGADRQAVRRALITLARRSPEAFAAHSEAWLAQGPDLSARIGLALVTANVGEPLTALSQKLVESSLGAEAFEDRFRLSLLSPALGPSGSLDSWLAKQAIDAEEWMQRRAAFEALAKRDSQLASKLAPRVAQDPYPRVRAAATAELARAGKRDALIGLARQDAWPVVRAAATSALAGFNDTRSVLEGLLEDTSRSVRAAAIDALAAQESEESWPLVEQRLTANQEWPVVQAAAVRFASALCIQAARPPLVHAARRSLRPDADDDDRRLGLEAIRALHDLGGAAAEDARRIASRESASPELMQTVDGFGPPRCSAQQKVATP